MRKRNLRWDLCRSFLNLLRVGRKQRRLFYWRLRCFWAVPHLLERPVFALQKGWHQGVEHREWAEVFPRLRVEFSFSKPHLSRSFLRLSLARSFWLLVSVNCRVFRWRDFWRLHHHRPWKRKRFITRPHLCTCTFEPFECKWKVEKKMCAYRSRFAFQLFATSDSFSKFPFHRRQS